jgi:hypothetical protein
MYTVEIWLTASVTGRQWMLALPGHLVPPQSYILRLESEFVQFSVLYLWDWSLFVTLAILFIYLFGCNFFQFQLSVRIHECWRTRCNTLKTRLLFRFIYCLAKMILFLHHQYRRVGCYMKFRSIWLISENVTQHPLYFWIHQRWNQESRRTKYYLPTG